MVFKPGIKPPKAGETISKEQSPDEIDSTIENMQKSTQEPEKVNISPEEGKSTEEFDEIKEEVGSAQKEQPISEILDIEYEDRTSEQHMRIVNECFEGDFGRYVEEHSSKKSIVEKSEDISTTYKGIKATRRRITQLIIGNQVVREEVEDTPTHANVTLE